MAFKAYLAELQRHLKSGQATEPTYYGEPLRHRYKGYWKLRVGDYRVVYRVVGQEVWVYRVDHRKDVYNLPIQRLVWRP